jgi:hypothetical protein
MPSIAVQPHFEFFPSPDALESFRIGGVMAI